MHQLCEYILHEIRLICCLHAFYFLWFLDLEVFDLTFMALWSQNWLLTMRKRKRLVVLVLLCLFVDLRNLLDLLSIQTVLEVRTALHVEVMQLPEHHGQVLSFPVEHIAFGFIIDLEL